MRDEEQIKDLTAEFRSLASSKVAINSSTYAESNTLKNLFHNVYTLGCSEKQHR